MVSGARAVARCDTLGVAPFSDAADGLYRGYLTPAYCAAQDALREWMVAAGMTVRIDAAANLIGRYEGRDHDAAPLLIGSHLDSVRDAGRYDGPLGILLGIECVAALHAEQRRLSFPIEIYAFGDEEGSRFPAAMLTSHAVAGTLNPAALAIADADGTTLRDALATAGLALDRFADAGRARALAYLEAHIEQGPVLDTADLPVGCVTAIAAQHRYAVTVTGQAGHAGTTTMNLRRDALAAAAAMILAAEQVARDGSDDLVATVGRIDALPGAANVVAGRVTMTLDVRAGTDRTRDAAARQILAAFDAIAATLGVTLAIELLQDLPATPCDPALVAMLDAAIADTGVPVRRLVSGAGHDAMVMRALCPVAMLFVRCASGISHNPAESVNPADADIALAVMRRFIDRLEDTPRAA